MSSFVGRVQGLVAVDFSILDASDGNAQQTMVRTGTNGENIYVFYVDSTADLVYRKSTDSGKTWATEVTIEGTKAWIGASVWYDRWTIGDTTGDIIHIFATNSTDLDCVYFSLDTDDDSAGANNNTIIDTAATTISPPAGGRICGCKGKNGDLLIAYVANAHTIQAGWNFYKSDDTGSTWVVKNGGGNPAQYVNNTGFGAIIMPLDTDDDFLFMGYDTNNNDMFLCVFDNSATNDWESTVGRPNAFASISSDGVSGTQLNCAYDHSNADCFFCFENDENGSTICETVSMFYDESERSIALEDYGVVGGVMELDSGLDLQWGYFVGRTITRNSDTGQLIVIGTVGDQALAVVPAYVISNDNGRHWSNIIRIYSWESINAASPDDYRRFYTTPFTNTASGLAWLEYNDDINDIYCSRSPMTLFDSETGNCKDNAGANAQDVTVRMYLKGRTEHAWLDQDEIFVGQDITDSSGNWAIAPPPAQYGYNLAGERSYYVTYYENKGDIATPVVLKWKMDDDGWGADLGDQFVYDTGNEEIDFATASDAGNQQVALTALVGLTSYWFPWTWDFDIRIDTLTQGSNAEDNDLFVINTDERSNGLDAVHDTAHGLRLVVSSTENEWQLIVCESGDIPLTVTAVATFSTTPTTGTKYWRLGMKSKDILSLALYSAATRLPGELVEEETYDISQIPLVNSWSNLGRYKLIGLDNHTAADSTIDGAMSNLRFYAESTGNVITANTGSDTDLTDMSHVKGQI